MRHVIDVESVSFVDSISYGKVLTDQEKSDLLKIEKEIREEDDSSRNPI